MFSSNTTNVNGGAPDAQFNYVTMLLRGDGTNGAQNNTFLDSSTNNFTITRNGNTTQGSFSPYGSNWSNYLGSGNSIYISTSSVFAFTADLTIEAWVFLNNTATSGGFDPRLINIGGGIDILFVDSTKAVQVKNNGTTVLTSSSSAVSLNNWLHIAIVRNGSTLTAYINGTSVGSATYSSTFSDTGDARIARLEGSGSGYLDGYISNLRVVKGSAVYTSNFTPSTTPLTAITNTQLLTCQSNRFKDNSNNNFSLTASGSPSVQRFNPFGASTAYSTSVIGGSGYFDGSGDYLTLADNAALDVDAGDFTLEAWVYLSDATVTSPVLAKGFGSAGGWMMWVQSTLRLRMYDAGGSSVTATSSASLTSNSWNHVAATRSGNTLTVWVNGVSSGTATFTGTSTNASVLEIGGYGSATAVSTGYISNARLVKGTAVYTSAFTPSTTPLTAISGTSLLTSMTNGAIFDNAMMNDLETVGNAQISTSVKKYGTGSLAFDGTGDAIKAAYTPNFAFGTGDFTIELWLYINSTSGTPIVFDMREVGGSQTPVIYLNGSALVYYTNAGVRITGGTLSTGTWYHIAVCRSGTSTKMFLDGTQIGSTYTDSTTYAGGNLWLGQYYGGGYDLNGYIDDLRITKGYARYTANFTPPTAAFPNTGPI